MFAYTVAVAFALAWATLGLASGAPAAPPAPSPPPQCEAPIYTEALTRTPWALDRLKPKEAWRLARGHGVTVAVIDSGVSPSHPLLRGQVLPGADLLRPGSNGQCDEDGHGTLVAGIIAARDTGDDPFYGVAPEAEILPIRVLRDSKKDADPQFSARVAKAVRLAVDKQAQVVNLSLVTDPSQELKEAIRYAVDKDVVLVAATGNDGSSEQRMYPAAYDQVIGVAGIGPDGRHVKTSHAGIEVDVAAPGYEIVGPAPRGDRFRSEREGGTSFAAAYVSGVAALIRSYAPDLSASQVAWRVEQTADAPPQGGSDQAQGRNDQFGHGVVNPWRAVSALLAAPGEQAVTAVGRIPEAEPLPDPLGTVRWTAVWTGTSGSLLAALVLATPSVVRRGAQRGWRAASAPVTTAAASVGAQGRPGADPGRDPDAASDRISDRTSDRDPGVVRPPGSPMRRERKAAGRNTRSRLVRLAVVAGCFVASYLVSTVLTGHEGTAEPVRPATPASPRPTPPGSSSTSGLPLTRSGTGTPASSTGTPASSTGTPASSTGVVRAPQNLAIAARRGKRILLTWTPVSVPDALVFVSHGPGATGPWELGERVTGGQVEVPVGDTGRHCFQLVMRVGVSTHRSNVACTRR
jgi:membrane-anchored mycosin MYCP